MKHLARSVSRLQLPATVGTSEVTGQQEPASKPSPEPFKLQFVAIGEFPDGPKLRLTANKKFRLLGFDYLDENGARVASDGSLSIPSQAVEAKGQQLKLLWITQSSY